MDWPRAIEANCDNLIRIVTRLFIMAGIRTGVCVLTLPRELRIRILLILRPAEFAARRLIMMAACKLDLQLPEATGARQQGRSPKLKGGTDDSARQQGRSPKLKGGTDNSARQRRVVGEELKGGTDDSARQPRTVGEELTGGTDNSGLPLAKEETPTLEDETSGSHQQGRTPTCEYWTSGARRRGAPDSGLPLATEESDSGLPLAKKEGPALKAGTSGAHQRGRSPTLKDGTERPPVFQLFDPFKCFGPTWLTEEEFAALNDPGRMARPPETVLSPDAPVDARSVCRRILALIYALDDLEGQARRLARWRARHSAESSSSSGLTRGPGRSSPMRWGRPPGWKKRPKSEIEGVLKECHSLARLAWDGPDTS